MYSYTYELSPYYLLNHVKKHPHTHTLSSYAFSVNKRDFVVHNLSMKADPINDFDAINYRRGLAFVYYIVNFKYTVLRVAKKGLRKFHDLMPYYITEKTSHISNSKHYSSIKSHLFYPLKTEVYFYTMYTSEKANGYNAQISYDFEGEFWVVGSKNKTLILSDIKDIKYLVNKHYHIRTIAIAYMWFRYLYEHTYHLDKIKEKLSEHTLIGYICDSDKNGHIVDYGSEPRLFFYALVSKNDSQHTCAPTSYFLSFAYEVSLGQFVTKIQSTQIQTLEALMGELKQKLYEISYGTLENFGEGVVIYLTTNKKNGEQIVEYCVTVCKIKTLEYRIYRKLREKLKVFFEKYRKGYDKSLSKYIEEVKELRHGFKLPKPDYYYENVAKKAFLFCENQEKQIAKFVQNRFISFLKIVQNEKIDREIFKKIVHQDMSNSYITKLLSENIQNPIQNPTYKSNTATTSNETQNPISSSPERKNLLVLVPMSIPASGKSTLFKKLSSYSKKYFIKILSSDEVRLYKMNELLQKQKNLSKKSAYEKTRQSANKQYYSYLQSILQYMDKNTTHKYFILFLDKNHPYNALKSTLYYINKAKGKTNTLNVKVVGVLPQCENILSDKPKYMYPFSSCFITVCLKRLLNRPTHYTLYGTYTERSNVCINFANMFRNFSISNYNLGKYFDSVVFLPFVQEQEVPKQITYQIVKVMMGSRPGSFDYHPYLYKLVEEIKKWDYAYINTEYKLPYIYDKIAQLFANFETLKVDVYGTQNKKY